MCEYAEYQTSQDQYISTQTISVSLLCTPLRLACSGALFDRVARKVGAVRSVDLGESGGQQQQQRDKCRDGLHFVVVEESKLRAASCETYSRRKSRSAPSKDRKRGCSLLLRVTSFFLPTTSRSNHSPWHPSCKRKRSMTCDCAHVDSLSRSMLQHEWPRNQPCRQNIIS